MDCLIGEFPAVADGEDFEAARNVCEMRDELIVNVWA